MQELNIKMVDWFDDHFYQVQIGDNIEYFPSVTTKLNIIDKPYLARWRGDIGNNEADRRMREAMDKGSRIHYAWNVMNRGGIVVYNPYNRPNYTQEQLTELKETNDLMYIIENQAEMVEIHRLQRWAEAVLPEFLESERIVYSMKRREAGTMDNLIRIKTTEEHLINGANPLRLLKGLYIVDVKTGKTVDDNAELQTAAYASFYREMFKKKITGTIVIHTNAATRKGIEGLSTLVRYAKDVKKNYIDYCHVADIWDRKQKESTKPKVFQFPSICALPNFKTNAKKTV